MRNPEGNGSWGREPRFVLRFPTVSDSFSGSSGLPSSTACAKSIVQTLLAKSPNPQGPESLRRPESEMSFRSACAPSRYARKGARELRLSVPSLPRRMFWKEPTGANERFGLSAPTCISQCPRSSGSIIDLEGRDRLSARRCLCRAMGGLNFIKPITGEIG